ncbi:Putative transcriptional regulator, RpiR family protein [Spiroplasma clarkii]|uniref:HTH rpiR-type domain-containing protein n=1 Tax=Spiroplasma clarkii TaxID=2139 RepID=A0A1Y0L250_9MOLU|nr:MurR/RpiR family transcriptional regulator [Spiroplasma clarkii]ARU91805.1 Putative transcriptional regulator, RpiR family protein [Spiroplasma clarkii]ATX71171.1 hypothetical protein SCLAR_v1c08630 [Spiroplasma clarkii]
MEFSILSKIKSACKLDLAENGIYVSIANILLEKLNVLDKISIISLSKEANVSPASITRFARKFGYSGWKDFIEALKREYNMSSTPIVSNSSKSKLLLYAKTITNSITAVAKENANSIDEVVAKLDNFKDCIYLFGIGANMDVIKIFSSELSALGFNVRYDSDYANQIRLSKIAKHEDLVFIFSHSMIGETIEAIFSNIKNQQCEIVLISHNKISDTIFINVPQNEAVHKNSHSKSSFAMLFLAYAIINNIIEIKLKNEKRTN